MYYLLYLNALFKSLLQIKHYKRVQRMNIERLLPPFQSLSWASPLALACGLSWGLAQAQEARIEAFGPAFNQPEAAAQSQARVYAYRTAESLNPAPINLYINGRYHASLLRGGYTEFCLSPGRPMLQSALDDASQLHQGKTLPGQPLEAQAGRVIYLRVLEGTGRQTQLQTAGESQALNEIRRTRRQQHTVSRAPEVQACVAATPEPARPMPKRDFTLASDALFAFGKSTLRPEGEEAIETLAKQVLMEYARLDRIHVAGYTDAIGPTELNNRLSRERALTVARLLDQYGLHPMRGYATEGRGSSDLAKIGCQNKPTPENKACHAPNRRVVISITGTRK